MFVNNINIQPVPHKCLVNGFYLLDIAESVRLRLEPERASAVRRKKDRNIGTKLGTPNVLQLFSLPAKLSKFVKPPAGNAGVIYKPVPVHFRAYIRCPPSEKDHRVGSVCEGLQGIALYHSRRGSLLHRRPAARSAAQLLHYPEVLPLCAAYHIEICRC